jgi:hypothetical protein
VNYNGPRKARDEIIVPLFKAKGIGVVSYEVPYPQSTADISNSAEGIKTVAFLCPGAWASS